MYKVFIYLAMFLIYSFIGWIMEVIKTYPIYKKFVNRGFLIGPVIPIYGVGAMLITLILKQFDYNKILLFILAIITCSILEYITSYIMEKLFKTRWWDYSDEKFNLNGRICLKNSIAFGFLSLLLIYIVNPFVISILEKIDPIILKAVISILIILFFIDFFISFKIIYSIKGVGLSLIKDSTEEINEKVKNIISNKGLFTRRIVKAFPNFKISDKVIERIKKVKNKH